MRQTTNVFPLKNPVANVNVSKQVPLATKTVDKNMYNIRKQNN